MIVRGQGPKKVGPRLRSIRQKRNKGRLIDNGQLHKNETKVGFGPGRLHKNVNKVWFRLRSVARNVGEGH